MSAVEPSVDSAVAVNCWVFPTTKLDTTERDTAMEDIVGPVEGVDTIKFIAALVTPNRDTVIFVFPAEIPVAAPMVVMAAMVGAELVHVPVKVASSCDPSEKVARQVNCWLAFTDNLNGDFCSMVM